MLLALLLVLIVLWFLGYGPIQSLYFPLFHLGGRTINLWDIIIFLVVLWVIGILPSPLREIAGILLILWLLSTLGILAIAGLANLLVIAIIVGIVLSFIR